MATINLFGALALDTTVTAVKTAIENVRNFLFSTTAKLPLETENFLGMRPLPQKFWRTDFTRSYASGIDPEFFDIIVQGAGHTISQSAGKLVIASGTNPYTDTIIRSKQSIKGAFTLKDVIGFSQRIANNSWFVELVDVIGDNLAITVNSSTSVTVTIPNNPFTTANIGQSMNILGVQGIASAHIGAYAISGVSGNNVTFTVAAWPSSGSGTCSLSGWNSYQVVYNGTSGTSALFGTQRNGWTPGYSTITTLQTIVANGHMMMINSNSGVVSAIDQSVSSVIVNPQNHRGSRVNSIPGNDVELFLQIRCANLFTAPASSTTCTISGISLEEYTPIQTDITGVRQHSPNALLQATIPTTTLVNWTTTPIVIAVGAAAHDAVASNNPVRIGARAHNVQPAPVSADGDAVNLMATMVGALLVRQDALPESTWNFAPVSAIANSATAVTIKSAAGAGIRNYLKSLHIDNDTLGAVTEIAVRDGAAGTVLYRGRLQTTAGDKTLYFDPPLRGSAATLMEVVTLTAVTGNVYVNAQGYTAP